jgi:hypothetical protein
MKNETEMAKTIMDCTRGNVFCQHYCLYRLNGDDVDELGYCLRRARLRYVNFDEEIVQTGGLGSPQWYNSMKNFVCQFLMVSELNLDKDKIINFLMSYV